ncbi:Rieske 2Fe-2S domain-containing protein [Haloferax larsenii]|uniref:Rieske 2Fe-2S domain-containing protein n=1 Tax=Haloferax larsenii TaxID=302484 RepID=A0ABY5RF83_HALLR|nr:Rieske 2Fe-2S domain-containing protein [Haloferax larsenii]UVE51027.1 Rieske 2Fe-2S domain-containing protein [Haloferax larsenii]
MSHGIDESQSTSQTEFGRVKALLERMGETLEDGEVPMQILNDDAVHQLELERIFGQTWVYVGHESEVPEPGDYRQRTIGEDPFIFVRGEDGDFRVLFNSCRHRGANVCRAEKGNTSHFRCPYHGWTYKNTGDLVGVPQKAAGFDHIEPENRGLHEAPHVEEYNGLVFACVAPDVEPLEEFLGGATWFLDMYFDLIDMEVIGDPHRWEVENDWKTPTENFYGDNYHIPMGHKSAIDAGVGSDTATGEKESNLYGIADCDGHGFSFYQIESEEDSYWGHPPEVVETFNHDTLDADQHEVARKSGVTLGTIFPNLSFIFLGGRDDPEKDSVGTFLLRKWEPRGAGKMEVVNWILAPKDASDEYKERVYEVGMSNFSPSGNFEVDDVGIWYGIDEAAGSVFARQNDDVNTLFTMGRGENPAATVYEEWVGPGTAYLEGGMTDENQLDFYRTWHEAMTSDGGM